MFNIEDVAHPKHYTEGKIECIDFIIDKQLNFCLGNAVKYIVRAGKKEGNSAEQDIRKAIQYLLFYINKELKNESETDK